LYRSGLFVDYPSDRATRRGSCIFIHIWRAPGTGTAGCVGLPEARGEALQEFSRAAAVLAVLPATAFDRFPRCIPAQSVRAAPFTGGIRQADLNAAAGLVHAMFSETLSSARPRAGAPRDARVAGTP